MEHTGLMPLFRGLLRKLGGAAIADLLMTVFKIYTRPTYTHILSVATTRDAKSNVSVMCLTIRKETPLILMIRRSSK